MLGIKRPTENVTAFVKPPRLAHLLGATLSVVAALTQRGELSERRVGFAAGTDWFLVVDYIGRLD
jgi:hypothetical protein